MSKGALALLLAACVPSTESADPRGAAGFALQPSAATRGEPFDTSDGYRITIERLVVNAAVFAESVDSRDDGDFEGGSDQTLFDAIRGEPFFTPAVLVGTAQVRFSFAQSALPPARELGPVVQASAEPFARRFFEAQPDVAASSVDLIGEPYFRYGPSILFAFHAEGHGKTYDLDLTFDSTFASDVFPSPEVEVEANALEVAPLSVRAELMFVPPLQGMQYGLPDLAGGPRFADFAAADTDDDGRLTAAELAAAPSDIGALDLATALVQRTAHLFSVAGLDSLGDGEPQAER